MTDLFDGPRQQRGSMTRPGQPDTRMLPGGFLGAKGSGHPWAARILQQFKHGRQSVQHRGPHRAIGVGVIVNGGV